MSAAIVSGFHQDYRHLYKGLQSHRATTDFRQQVSALSSFINIPSATQGSSPLPLLKNLPSLNSLKTQMKQHAPLTSSNSVAICNVASHLKSNIATTKEHRKLDRSVSEPVDRSQASLKLAPSNSSRYKTELCRPFEESGTCKYGDKCQFAHGIAELRSLTRHPKYKTEPCRTFHSTGFCPYGPRCHFIHNSEDAKKCLLNTLQHTGQSPGSEDLPPTKLSPPIPSKEIEISNFNLGSTGEPSPPLSSNCSSSPPSSLNNFFLDESCNLSKVPQTAPPLMTGRFFFGPDYASTLSSVSSQQGTFPIRQSFPEDEIVLSSINLLVSEIDNLKCKDDKITKTELLSPKSDEMEANNGVRLPVFSWLAHGN